jgi:hypothetical protein
VANLYAIGWRQGSFVEAELPAAGFTLDDQGQLWACSGTHRTWVVASQDCDLNDWETTRTEPLVELRTRITAKDPDTEWGIRSRVVRLTETEGVHSDSAPLRISPAALVASAQPANVITPARAIAFKTWLGRRYDRPAVPDDQVTLAKDIASRARRPSRRGFAVDLHDVLIQFDDQTTPPTFLLFAVIVDGTDKEVARRWLTEVGMAVPDRLGVLGGVDAGYRSETSLELIESSYSADLSGLSWSGPHPYGAL